MTPRRGSANQRRDRERGSATIAACGAMSSGDEEVATAAGGGPRRAGPTTRRVADRHYLAVVAAEIHRLALGLRAPPRVRTLGSRRPMSA